MSPQIALLIVDDDVALCQLIAAALRSDSVRVFEANTVDQAQALIRISPPDIALIDVQLSGEVSGVDLTRFINEESPETSIGIISAWIDEDTMLKLIQAGASDILRKPLNLTHLRQMMSRFLWRVNRRRSRIFHRHQIQKGTLELSLASSPRVILPAVQAVSHLLSGLITERELAGIELGLHEILRNALEHGNLKISSTEKTRHYATGRYEEIVEKRADEAQEAGREIRLRAAIDDDTLILEVEDDGDGFQWEDFLAGTSAPAAFDQLHGRGLYLIKQTFDRISFNEKGNRISVVRRWRGAPSALEEERRA